jgi:hypothetical protein
MVTTHHSKGKDDPEKCFSALRALFTDEHEIYASAIVAASDRSVTEACATSP